MDIDNLYKTGVFTNLDTGKEYELGGIVFTSDHFNKPDYPITSDTPIKGRGYYAVTKEGTAGVFEVISTDDGDKFPKCVTTLVDSTKNYTYHNGGAI